MAHQTVRRRYDDGDCQFARLRVEAREGVQHFDRPFHCAGNTRTALQLTKIAYESGKRDGRRAYDRELEQAVERLLVELAQLEQNECLTNGQEERTDSAENAGLDLLHKSWESETSRSPKSQELSQGKPDTRICEGSTTTKEHPDLGKQQIQQKLGEALSAIRALRLQHKDVQMQLSRANEETEKLREQQLGHNIEVSKMRTKLHEAQEQIKASNSSLSAAQEDLKNKTAEHQTALQRSQSSDTDAILRSRVSSLEQTLERQNKSKVEEVEELRKLLGERERSMLEACFSHAQKKMELNFENKGLERRVKALLRDKDLQDREYQKFQQKLQDMERNVEVTRASYIDNSTYERDISEKNDMIRRLEDKLYVIGEANSENEQRVQGLEADLTQLVPLRRFFTDRNFAGNARRPDMTWEEMTYAMRAASQGMLPNQPQSDHRRNINSGEGVT